MAKLHRHFDTNNSIFLLLEYSSGGCLWNHVKSFRQYYCKSRDTSGFPDDFNIASSDISGECELTSRECEPISGECESTSGACKTTSVDETVPKCKLDYDDRQEIIGNESSRNHTLNSLKVSLEKNNLNTFSEVCDSPEGTSTFPDRVPDGTESRPDGSSEQKTSLMEQGTCLDQNTERSLKENENKTSQPPSGDVLGLLDHVTKDHSAMDKCVQHWIAELLLAIDSVHSCGIILK